MSLPRWHHPLRRDEHDEDSEAREDSRRHRAIVRRFPQTFNRNGPRPLKVGGDPRAPRCLRHGRLELAGFSHVEQTGI